MIYHITENFCVIKFFAEFCCQFQSAKIKIREIFSLFLQISVEELVMPIVALCGIRVATGQGKVREI